MPAKQRQQVRKGSHGGMQIVLTEDVAHVGKQGDLVEVKPGFGRNYLLPRGKALMKSLVLVAWPVAAVSVWFAYQWSSSMPVGYRPHGQFLVLYAHNLGVILREMMAALSGRDWRADGSTLTREHRPDHSDGGGRSNRVTSEDMDVSQSGRGPRPVAARHLRA